MRYSTSFERRIAFSTGPRPISSIPYRRVLSILTLNSRSSRASSIVLNVAACIALNDMKPLRLTYSQATGVSPAILFPHTTNIAGFSREASFRFEARLILLALFAKINAQAQRLRSALPMRARER